jgi:RNA polymerase sigma-70 factor, ECF subfamily
MKTAESHDVTALLRAWKAGDESALNKLAPLMYRELHRLARRYMAAERSGHSLQATALINEVYVRLIGANQVDWQNRAHFLAVCAQLMRRILTDFARSRLRQKRGAAARHFTLDETLLVSSQPDRNLLELDEALERFATIDERKSRVVELRFFGGLEVEETAVVLGVSPQTVMRDWKLARIWLLRELSGIRRHGT